MTVTSVQTWQCLSSDCCLQGHMGPGPPWTCRLQAGQTSKHRTLGLQLNMGRISEHECIDPNFRPWSQSSVRVNGITQTIPSAFTMTCNCPHQCSPFWEQLDSRFVSVNLSRTGSEGQCCLQQTPQVLDRLQLSCSWRGTHPIATGSESWGEGGAQNQPE